VSASTPPGMVDSVELMHWVKAIDFPCGSLVPRVEMMTANPSTYAARLAKWKG
jgi:hypothetical protein